MTKLLWLVPLLPLAGFLFITFFKSKLSKNAIGIIGSGAVLGSFVISLGIFFQLINHKEVVAQTFDYFPWITAGKFIAPFSFLIDPLSSIFLLIITGVGFLIHLYSIGYMHDDEGFGRFFSYLNLFIFFMLLLVLGSNFLIMFVGWEGVGLCSYLLIGFWFKNQSYNSAAKKAFIINRIGDLGFLLGIFLIFITFGSITYSDVFSQASHFASNEPVLVAITVLLFIGAMGKSAQIPLYTWLPDAMAGPTPVSALIHAATMVTAGIYMIARSNILYTLSPTTMTFVAIIGITTALFAATIGLAQNDIKKVLAYSTVSQLGLIFLGLGVGAYTGAVFHVVTHAFFKALLFLGAGSVIHAMSNEQDIRNMGGLKKALPVTFTTFLIGTLAISGIPPLSGFFSKDEILAHAFNHNVILWILGVITTLMTAFYMFRLFFLTFYGNFRGSDHQKNHLHESPKVMIIPLVVLALFSIIAGFIGIPEALHGSHWLNNFLAPVFEASEYKILPMSISHATEYGLMIIVTLLVLGIIALAYVRYVKKEEVPEEDENITQPAHKLVYNKYYVDELYYNLITRPLNWISLQFYKVFDNAIIYGVVNSVGKAVNAGGRTLRLVQSGNVGFYIFAMVISMIIILLLKSI